MDDNQVFPVSEEWRARAWCNSETYDSMYARSIEDPEGFWSEHGQRLDWIKP